MLDRRTLLQAGALGVLPLLAPGSVGAIPAAPTDTLRTAPIEVFGQWGGMLPGSVHQVLDRMRQACLAGFRLLSDEQPDRLRVEEHTLGPPAVWLHADPARPDLARTAWIIVDVGQRDWSRLAYQFGHELGHVTANSWRPDARPAAPCQWLEEAMVEAFSLRGLARLADGWSEAPPFPGDGRFGTAIATYRQDTIESYARLADRQGHAGDPAAWFKANRQALEAQPYLSDLAKAASLPILVAYEDDPTGMEALGALNRWRGRSALPLEDYFEAWRRSCAELGASPALPNRLQAIFAP